MAYLAMARKWRPSSFSDLVGQEHVARTIENAIRADRIHHAFLFTGTRGVGKTTSARILARTLNCQGPNPILPCGECPSCKEIAAGNSLDVIEMDGASHNSVEDVRDLIEQVQYAPMTGKYKVYVIDEVHMLSKAAFNALLKTLEEPPPRVVFIFATTEVNKVPPTILSRVLRFDFRRIGPKRIQERLQFICEQEKIEAESGALALIAELADGSMRDALTLFDQVYAFSGQSMTLDSARDVTGVPAEEAFQKLAESVFGHDQAGVLTAIDTLVQAGTEIPVLLEGFARFLRNMLYARSAGPDAASLLNLDGERLERFRTLASDAVAGDILRAARIITDLQISLRNAPNPRLLTEMAFSRMSHLDRVADLRKLIAAGDSPAAKKKLSHEKATAASPAAPIAPAPILSQAEPPAPPAQPLVSATPPPVLDSEFGDIFAEPAPRRSKSVPSSGSEPPLDDLPPALDEYAPMDAEEDSLPAFEPEPAPPVQAPVASVATFHKESAPGRTSQFSLYEVTNRWNAIVETFQEVEPVAGSLLEGTSIEKGDYTQDPFPLRIFFQGAHRFIYEQFQSEPRYQQALVEHLEHILGVHVSLDIIFQGGARPKGHQAPQPVQRTIGSAWDKDMQDEPILRLLNDIFETDLLATTRVSTPSETDGAAK